MTTDTFTSQLPAPLWERYLRTVWTLTWRPSVFFKGWVREPSFVDAERGTSAESFSAPIVFALTTHWIGAAGAFLWQSAVGGYLKRETSQFWQILGQITGSLGGQTEWSTLSSLSDRVLAWMWGAGSVLLTPFSTLFTLTLASAVVWMGARLLVRGEVRWDQVFKLCCYASAPAWFRLIPIAGPFVASMASFLVLTAGVREAYRTGWTRASIIAAFPQVLLLVLVLALVALIGAAVFQLVQTLF